MNLILLVLLCSFISANLILIQKKYILTKLSGNQYFCVYKSSESNIKQKVSFENNLLYVSPIIKTIIILSG